MCIYIYTNTSTSTHSLRHYELVSGENGKYETLLGALSTMALCHGYYGRQHTASEKFPQEDPRGQ